MTPEFDNVASVWEETIAYETLWEIGEGSLKSVSNYFMRFPGLPSSVLNRIRSFHAHESLRKFHEIKSYLEKQGSFSVCVKGTFQYPKGLHDAKYPLELFYYQGDIGVVESRCVSVVGSRSVSNDGIRRAAKLVKGLVGEGFTIVSGLATGVDTAAMTAAIELGGRTIGVIGTPINTAYPRENTELQNKVAREHLLISQVPFYWYSHEPFPMKKRYFPQRNETMSALSEATIIVEASNASGTLTQARACLQQKRKLFILNACFEDRSITWPQYYESKGAIRVHNFDDIFSVLMDSSGS